MNVPPQRRGTRVTQLLAEAASEYTPARDFWLPVRTAIATDRRTTRDGKALDAAVTNATARRRASYERAAAQWVHVASRWSGSAFEAAPKVVVLAGGMPVSVRANFIEAWPDRRREAVLVWLPAETLHPDAIVAAQTLLRRAYPNATPVVVDLPRGVVAPADVAALSAMAAWFDAESAALANRLDAA